MHDQTKISGPACGQAQSITDGLQTLNYIPNGSGRITASSEESWQPVNEVNHQAWEEIDRHIARATRKIDSGRASCLYYYMVANQMSILLLAKYTRQPFWKVFLHLLPFFFKRLSRRQLRPYARLFQVSEDDLRAGRLLPAVYHTGSRHG
jgi:hypothetical protein